MLWDVARPNLSLEELRQDGQREQRLLFTTVLVERALIHHLPVEQLGRTGFSAQKLYDHFTQPIESFQETAFPQTCLLH